MTARAPLEKRDYCLNELLETEANYVSVLEMLREKFMEPLRPLLGPEHTAAIFQGIQVQGPSTPPPYSGEFRYRIRAHRRIFQGIQVQGPSTPPSCSREFRHRA